ncbi:MAG: aspartate aminotransferase family protein [Pirellulales bacterium]
MSTHTDQAPSRATSSAASTAASLFDEYRSLTGRSALLVQRARQVFPSGVTHDSRFFEPYPLYVERAAGSRKWDVDGREYVDYTGGHGALLFGHNHPRIVAAIEEQLKRGTHYGAGHELEVRWGELVLKLLPAAERVRFTSSGTEATLLALRLARAATGKPKIVRFAGHFHGWHDHVAFGLGPNNEVLPTPGVLEDLARQMIIAPPNDAAALERIFDQHDDVAAVILEPTGGSWGQTPIVPSFLIQLRELTARRGVLLIFDEVISGFRVSPGGAQQHFGIAPDLTTLAKILAGGLPGGAIAGRAELLEALAFPPAGGPRRDKVPHHGTYNANPLSAAAGIAALEMVAQTDACARANEYAARLRDALQQVVVEAGVPWIVYGTFSGFHIFTNPDRLAVTADDIATGRCDWRTIKAAIRPGLTSKLRVGMIVHGVEIFNWPGGPTSSVHGDADLQRTAEAFRKTLRRLRDEGDV